MFLSLRHGYGYLESNWYSLQMDLFDGLYGLSLLASGCYFGLGTNGFTIHFEYPQYAHMWDLACIDMHACMNCTQLIYTRTLSDKKVFDVIWLLFSW